VIGYTEKQFSVEFATLRALMVKSFTIKNIKKKKNLRGLSPQANYTNRAAAAVGEVVPSFVGTGCYVVSATDSHGRVSQFSRPEPLLFH
jgi:hypothetical protein